MNAGQPSSTKGKTGCDRLCPHHTCSTQPACTMQVFSASTWHETAACLGCSVSRPQASSRECLACMIHLLTHALCVSCSVARRRAGRQAELGGPAQWWSVNSFLQRPCDAQKGVAIQEEAQTLPQRVLLYLVERQV